MRLLYGPVDSWRFGRSLGVDPLAARTKLCPFSCIYCQYGETRQPTARRQAFVPAGRLRDEVASLPDPAFDVVTFAGLGEPTLATNLPDLVAVIRQRFEQPVILLTNSALMIQQDVRRDLFGFDAVVAKVDAPDEALFRRINRPGRGFPCSLPAIVEGIRRFRQEYAGRLVLQIMILQANRHAVEEMAALARSLEPDEVQLNTPLQPALGGPVSADEMREAESAFAEAFATAGAEVPIQSVYGGGRARVKPRLM